MSNDDIDVEPVENVLSQELLDVKSRISQINGVTVENNHEIPALRVVVADDTQQRFLQDIKMLQRRYSFELTQVPEDASHMKAYRIEATE